ncbi:zinc finger protein 808 isoform X2 [Bicyclus anynana]|uniref:Zinc finger protein 808 isoform X2 n=1 Tax=Bicyclus anynana TaxID=110368 RepID=A0ABM3M248_BICAN|nr:zinc finger protein 808 isoform X2 [Bicyclus anynana]
MNSGLKKNTTTICAYSCGHADDAPGDHHLPVDDEDWSHHASGDKFPSVTGNDWSHQASGDRSPPVPDENRSPLGVEYGSHQGSGDDSQPVTAAEPTHHASRGEVPPVVETTTHASCHVYESLPAANANLTYHTTGFDANRVCRVILKKCDSEIRLRDTNVCIPIQSNYNSRSSKKTFSSSSSNKCVKESQNNVKSHALLCDLCGFECKRKNTLLRHILAHFGSKSYSLRYRRMRSHAGETSYYCNECNYKAKVKSHLDRHKRCHSNERPYSCKLCNFKSKRSDNLKKHVETHYAVKKPHACSFCDYACVYKKIMQRHMTKAHPKLHVSLSRVQSHVTTSYPTGHKKVNAATKCNSPVY